MAIKISQSFKRTAGFPIDETMLLTSAEMLAIDDADMPDVYFALNSDDGKMYIYNKNNTASATTGKFKVLEGGGGLSDITFVAPAYDDTATYVAGDVVTYDGKRYVANTDVTAEDPFDPTHWDEQDIQEAIDAVSSGATIGKNYTTNITVGGLAENTSITSDMTLASLIEKMTTTVYDPTFVAPSASLTYSAPTLVKVGGTIPSGAASVVYNAGAINLRGTKQADRGGAATQYRLKTTGAATDFDETNANGSYVVPALTRSTKGEISIIGTVDYGAGPQPKDSNGDDFGAPLPAGSVSTTAKKVEFILPFYHGVSSTSTISDFTGLTEDLSKKGNKTYSYDTTVQHVVIAYDSAYGDLSIIKDQNGFDVTDGFTKSTVTVDGQSYFVYVQDNATTDTGANYTFSF